MPTKLVVTWGTFDGELHPGHLHLLKSCTRYGDVVAFVANDATVRENKHREPIFTQDIRKANLLRTGLVKEVLLGSTDPEKNKQMTLDLRPDIYIFTEDQTSEWNMDLERRLKKQGTKVVWLKRHKPELYSTTKLYFSK